MMDPRAKALTALTLLFLFLGNSVSQTPDECDGSGRYCFADVVYECADGEPHLVEQCIHACRDGECVERESGGAISPGLRVQETPPEESEGEDMTLYILVGLAVVVIAGLFIWTLMKR